MTPVHVNYKLSRSWLAWSGTGDQLDSLIGRVRECAEQRRLSMNAEFDSRINATTDEFERRSITRERDQANEKAETGLAFRSGPEVTVMGPAREVRHQIDTRSVHHVEVYAHFNKWMDGDRVIVKLRSSESGGGASLYVESIDQSWGRSTTSALSDEIELGVPKWSRYRTLRGSVLLGFAETFVSYALAFLVLVSLTEPGTSWTPWASAVVALIVTVVLGLPSVRNWFFPPFELRTGEQSSGSRRIALLFGLLLSVPIGVIVNIISPS